MMLPSIERDRILVNVARRRLSNHRIARPTSGEPGAVVHWLGAVQAQDYLGALWAVGLRMRRATEATIERAIVDRTIVRTWPMRGTLHFVAPSDIRWMLELLTPRVISASGGRYRQLELDDTVFVRAARLAARALRGGKQLTRPALYQILNEGGVATRGSRGLHIVAHLAQTGLLCFGAREGKQPTFALLEEWIPGARSMARDAALAELSRRYFVSHGPATAHDFAWWSGLTMADARAGLEMSKPHLDHDVIDGRTYWLASTAPARVPPPASYLLPAFDEYTVAYRDRGAILDSAHAKRVNAGGGVLNPTIVIGGQVVGTWKRTFRKGSVVITPRPFARLGKAERLAVSTAAHRYGEFLEQPLLVEKNR